MAKIPNLSDMYADLYDQMQTLKNANKDEIATELERAKGMALMSGELASWADKELQAVRMTGGVFSKEALMSKAVDLLPEPPKQKRNPGLLMDEFTRK